MYPVAEFRRRCFRAIRCGLLTLVAGVVTVALFGVTALHLSDPWGRHDPERRILLVWGTISAAGLTLLFESLWRHSRHPFTRCPHCRRPLTDFVPTVVASGCCYHCGGRVLEPPDETPADALIPRAEFLAADTGFQGKAAPVLVGGVFATYLGCGGALAMVERFHLPDVLGVVVFLTLAAVAPVSAVAVLRWMAAAGKRNTALACPTCGKLLAGSRMSVAATGNCTACGCRAIVPRTRPLPPPHLGPLWTIRQLTALERDRRRATRWMLVLLGLIFVLTIGLIVVGRPFWEADRLWRMGWHPVAADWGERVCPLLVGSFGAVVGILVLRHSLRSASRRHPIDCPRCGREMAVPFARATRCCSQCGWRAVAG